MYKYIHACIYLSIYLSIYIYIYLYICTYTDINIHIPSLDRRLWASPTLDVVTPPPPTRGP